MSVIVMGIFRFFVCLFLLLLSSASFAVDNEFDDSGIYQSFIENTDGSVTLHLKANPGLSDQFEDVTTLEFDLSYNPAHITGGSISSADVSSRADVIIANEDIAGTFSVGQYYFDGLDLRAEALVLEITFNFLPGVTSTSFEVKKLLFNGVSIEGSLATYNFLDRDGDGCADSIDQFPDDLEECFDSDGDLVGDNADALPDNPNEYIDTDGDGVGDNSDKFPNDPSESLDTDQDGIGNNADLDDDNDGVLDQEDSNPLDPTIGPPIQMVSVLGEPTGFIGSTVSVDIGYSSSDNNNQLPGLGFRIHFDSSYFSHNETQIYIDQDLIVDSEGPFFDHENFDNDYKTDQYITVAWASVGGSWPNTELPAKLLTAKFNVLETIDASSPSTSTISFSDISVTTGYIFDSTSYDINILVATWDFDGNGQADALTDGLLFLRYTFGLRGEILTKDVMATDSPLTSSQVEAEIVKAISIADIDDNGNVDALTDGILLLRYLFDLDGEALVKGVTGYDAKRSSAEDIKSYLEIFLLGASLPNPAYYATTLLEQGAIRQEFLANDNGTLTVKFFVDDSVASDYQDGLEAILFTFNYESDKAEILTIDSIEYPSNPLISLVNTESYGQLKFAFIYFFGEIDDIDNKDPYDLDGGVGIVEITFDLGSHDAMSTFTVSEVGLQEAGVEVINYHEGSTVSVFNF